MSDDELRGWISDDRRHGVHINAGTLSDLAAEVLRLRAKEAAAEKLAEAAADLIMAADAAAMASNCGMADDAIRAAESALAAWEAVHDRA